jgi:hypothetical protein
VLAAAAQQQHHSAGLPRELMPSGAHPQEALSMADVLIAFAAFAETVVGGTCRPRLLPPASQSKSGAVLDLRGLWHPCAVPAPGGCIVPNDLVLGCAARVACDCYSLMLCVVI